MAGEDKRRRPGHPNLIAGPGPGRPKGSKSRVTLITDGLEEYYGDPKRGRQRVIRLVSALDRQARSGNGAIAKLVVDRVDGPQTQKIDMNIDLSKLTDDQLEQLETILAAAELGTGESGEGEA